MTTISKRNQTLLAMAILFIVVAVTSVFLSNANQVVRVGFIPWIGYEPVRLAQADYPAADKVLIKPMHSTASTKRALKAGEIDAGYLTLDEVISLQSEGVDVRVVLIANISAGADALMVKPGVDSVEALKGQRIAYEPYAIGELFFHKMLIDHNMTPKDVVGIPIRAQSEHLALWQDNKIDASVTFEPTISRLKELGAKKLYDSRQMPNTIIDVLAVKNTFIEQQPHAVQRLVDQHLFGVDRLRENLDNSLYEIASLQGVSYQQLYQALNGIVLPSREYNLKMLNDSQTMVSHIQMIEQIMLESGSIERAVKHDQLFSNAFIR